MAQCNTMYLLRLVYTLRFSKISDTPFKKDPEDEHFVDQKATTVVKPSAIDDFIRNFLLKMVSCVWFGGAIFKTSRVKIPAYICSQYHQGMLKSLDSFNTEWYELQSKKLVDENSLDEVPDIYKQNQQLEMELKLMREEVAKNQKIADQAQGIYT